MDRRAMSEAVKRKVAALITRPGPDGPEVIVFDHPVSGYQLPAGTVEDGESFEAAALREGWEETGALGLELVREVGVSTLRDEDRHIFHLRATVEMPDEWRVATPDGGGLIWWCSWMPIDESHALVHEHQRDWLDAARPALDQSAHGDPPPRLRDPLPPEFGGSELHAMFHGWPGVNRFVVFTFDDECDPETCTRAHGICVTADGAVVLVSSGDGLWDVPGGGKEHGETTMQNFVREVEEEACARVLDVQYLSALRFVEFSADGTVHHGGLHAQMWARVELQPWEPRFEIVGRRLLSAEEAVELCGLSNVAALTMERAARVDPLLSRGRA
jgi:8-oxo-dGTP pyrophosphatase MutT (NUDIX family)